MLTDARELAPGSVLESEFCVVGAGPVGIALAKELGRSDRAVTLVEAGGLSGSESRKDLVAAESVGESYFPVHKTLVHGFGGTSNHWFVGEGFRTRPLDSMDFQVRSVVPYSGWPFGRKELDPYYRRAQLFLGVGASSYETSEWAGLLGDSLFDLDPSRAASVVFLVVPGTGVMHYLESVRGSEHVHLVYNAHAAELDDSGDEVTALLARVEGGNEIRIHADHYILTAGGLGNPRLLLLSTRNAPSGIGNGNDLVGRFFMEHIGLRGGRFEPTDAELLAQPRNPYFSVDAGPVSVHTKLSLAAEVLESEALLNSTFFLDPMPLSRTSQAVRSFVVLRRAMSWRPVPGDLGSHAWKALAGLPAILDTAFRQATGRGRAGAIQLMAMAEQSPNPESRVTLSEKVNSIGIPRVRLDWRPTSQDISSIVRSEAILAEELHRAGVGVIRDGLDSEDLKWHISGQWHQLGTTRMGSAPDESVVDPDGRVHGMGNLWITGGSVFPTGGYANPTLTAVALALRLADKLNAMGEPMNRSKSENPKQEADRKPAE